MSEAQRDARERAITGITFSKGFNKPFTLATGPLDKPLEAMRTCMDELLTHWGIDALAQKTLSRPVKALDQAAWARKVQAVYPQGKLEASENGLVRVRLIVDPQGKPASCHIQMKAKDDDFEQAACSTMMRYARFEPALDAAGKPIASYFVTSVIYFMN